MYTKSNTNKHPSRFSEIHKSAKQVGRIVAFLTREQMDFIDKIGKDALFSTGKKLSRAAVAQAIIEGVRKMDISGNLVHSQEELELRVNELSKKSLPTLVDELKKTEREQEKDKNV